MIASRKSTARLSTGTCPFRSSMAPVTSASAPAEAATRVTVFTRATVLRELAVDRDQDRDEQDRDDVRDLDHRVDRRAGRVLVRIADRVTGNRGRVGLGTLAPV